MPQAFASSQDEVYLNGPAGETLRADREAFGRHRAVPRVLRGVGAGRGLAVTVRGTRLPAAVTLAPVGVLEIVHPEDERDSDLSLGLSGHARPADLGPEALVPAPPEPGRHLSGTSTTGAPA